MRIEKINENQIRCTLTKSDLEEHQLLLNELAFGSDHAKDLFRDMMAQASEELGFEAEDLPLMIEAVPVSSDKLVLIITKMENPDDIDEHMSKYMKPLDLLNSLEKDDSDIKEDVLEIEDNEPTTDKEFLSPLGNLIKEARRMAGKKSAKDTKEADRNQQLPESHRIYRFPSLAQTMDACKKIYPLYEGQNTLFKDSEDNFYYLILARENHPQEAFRQMGNVLSEFGLRIPYSDGASAYFEEHFIKIIENDAVNTLSSI